MKLVQTICVLLALAGCAAAQKVELAVVGGGMFSSNQNFKVDTTGAVEGSLAYQTFHVPLASLYIEVPIAAGLDTSAHAATGVLLCNGCAGSASLSSLFVAPGLKLKIGSLLPISPFVAAGVGVGHFREGFPGGGSATSNHTVVQYGGGLDMKIAPFFSVRGEVRDYYSGTPSFGSGFSGRQHNVLVGAGIVLRL